MRKKKNQKARRKTCHELYTTHYNASLTLGYHIGNEKEKNIS